jgi:core-2/I-Branching enzyme
MKKKRFILVIFIALCFNAAQLYADKVALLFLTLKDLNHAHLWQEQIEANEDHFSVYIHSKEPLSDPYFKKFRIKHIVATSWAIHLKAWQKLVKAALKDSDNKKFVFLSESCVPLQPLDKIYQALMKDNHTYMRYGRPWWPSNHNREVIELPKEHRWGNHEWVILNREHAKLIAKDKDIIEVVSRHGSDAESYPSSLFSLYDCLQEPNINNIITTYVDWEHNEGPHPHTFKDGGELDWALLQKAREQNAFFVRKVASSFPEEVLFSLINE